MRLFGRELRENIGEVKRLPMYFWYLFKVALVFRSPLELIRAYVAQRSPHSNVVETRSGMKILLSGHPHDFITVFVIVIREDYGRIPAKSIVVDVGANIGVFALWAVRCGASRVLAFEPSARTFEHLQRNIDANGLRGVIDPYREAEYDRDGDRVPFAREGSMYSAIDDASGGERDLVPTVTLNTIVARAGGRVGVLKLDCEGAEYAALAAANLAAVDAVKLEYHRGGVERLIASFESQDFRVSMLKRANDSPGNLWVERA
jgi:FkbM family methyltransferase